MQEMATEIFKNDGVGCAVVKSPLSYVTHMILVQRGGAGFTFRFCSKHAHTLQGKCVFQIPKPCV